MATHNEMLGTLNARIKSMGAIDVTSTVCPIVANHKQHSDQTLLLANLLHAADVGNPAKPWAIYQKWTERVVAEFFTQGDRERDLGFEPLDFMDRSNYKLLPIYQINFMDFVVIRLYKTLAGMEPYVNLKPCVDHIVDNHATWEAQIMEEEEMIRSLSNASERQDLANIASSGAIPMEQIDEESAGPPIQQESSEISEASRTSVEERNAVDLGEAADDRPRLFHGRRALSARLPSIEAEKKASTLLKRKTASDSPVGSLSGDGIYETHDGKRLTPRTLVRKSMNRAYETRLRRERIAKLCRTNRKEMGYYFILI